MNVPPRILPRSPVSHTQSGSWRSLLNLFILQFSSLPHVYFISPFYLYLPLSLICSSCQYFLSFSLSIYSSASFLPSALYLSNTSFSFTTWVQINQLIFSSTLCHPSHFNFTVVNSYEEKMVSVYETESKIIHFLHMILNSLVLRENVVPCSVNPQGQTKLP